jgi:hypothetical protein
MKKHQLLTVVCSLFSIITFAQPQFAAPGAQWWYGFKGGFIYSEGWNHTVYESDTIVAGKSCKKLHVTIYSRSNQADPYTAFSFDKFVYQQGDSVFLYNNPNWMLRWRTNPIVGTTYVIQQVSWSNAYPLTIRVDSIKTVIIGTQTVKKIWQTGTSSQGIGDHAVIYDRIGPEYGDFEYTNCWGALDCYPTTLCAYQDNITPHYDFTSSVCNLITNSHSPAVLQQPLLITPNPCSADLHFDLTPLAGQESNLSIINMAGKLVKTLKIDQSERYDLNTRELAPGQYVYRFTTKQAVYAGRFVKI